MKDYKFVNDWANFAALDSDGTLYEFERAPETLHDDDYAYRVDAGRWTQVSCDNDTTYRSTSLTARVPSKLEYRERDLMELNRQPNYYYSKHVSAMTAEGLNEKSDIAAELAQRDMKISELQMTIRNIFELANASRLDSKDSEDTLEDIRNECT